MPPTTSPSKSPNIVRAVSVVFILAGLGIAAWTFYSSRAVGPPPRFTIARNARSLLLVTVDTTRADHLQPYGADNIETPTLATLAREGITFEHAFAVAPITLPAHTSIHTGLYPPRHGVRNNGTHYVPQEVTTLAERLRASGLRTAAFVSAAVLERRYGLDQGFEVYDDDLAAGRERQPRMVPDRPAEVTVQAARAWLDTLSAGDRFFLWVHLYDPHAAYSPPPPYRDQYRDRLYDGEIAYMDAQIGHLLEHPRLGGEQRVVVAVIGDHGESLGEHGEQTHAILAYDATLHVPWIVKLPGGPAGLRIEPPVSQVDVVPTVLDLFGMAPDASLAGRSTVPLMEGRDLPFLRPLYSETYLPFYTYGWAKLRVLRVGEWKFIDAPGPELYDLKRDPRELANQFAQQPGAAHDLQRALKEFLPSAGAPEREVTLLLDSATAERLRSLGYLAEGSGALHAEGSRPDPKDVIDLHVGLERARLLSGDRLYPQAEEELLTILKKDPNNLAALIELANVLAELKRFDDAEGAFQKALTVDPKYARLHLLYATLQARRGRDEAALAQVETALEIDRRDPDAYIQKAQLLQKLHRDGEAEEILRQALADNPDYPRLNAVFAHLVEMRQGDFAAAETRLRKALEHDPFLVLGWRLLGELQERTDHTDEAVESYRQGLRREPDDTDLHARLGMLLARRGGAEAEGHLREAIRLDPEFRPDVHVALGAWLADQGRTAEALAEYARVLESAPDHPGARNNRAIALYRSGRVDEAEAEFEAVIAEHPEQTDALNNLAAIAINRTNWQRAEGLARRAVEIAPKLAEGWSNLGIALDEQGHFAEAEVAFRHALEVEPTYWQARNNLATTLRKAGRPQESAAMFEEVLRQVPSQPDVHLELGDLYAGPLADPARARIHYNAVLRHAPQHPQAAEIRRRLADLPSAPATPAAE